ncbi:MAG: hypothetical protein J6S19_04080 [Lentisphaeria bacterium]|nr:hypothetical protein [Lentisphaeria bacterium]
MRANDDDLRQRMLLGLGFDSKDGHKRYTKGEDFVLMGGSEETHEKMTETAIKVSEKLAKRGKTIRTASEEELRDTFGELNG